MRKRVIAILVGTLLALIGATVWAPVIDNSVPYRYINQPTSTPLEDFLVRTPSNLYWRPICRATFGERTTQPEVVVDFIELSAVMDNGGRDLRLRSFVQVEVLALTHGLNLLGGGVLTWVVRRDRRSRADVG